MWSCSRIEVVNEGDKYDKDNYEDDEYDYMMDMYNFAIKYI